MAFKVKDLMINLIPEQAGAALNPACQINTHLCKIPSCFGCSVVISCYQIHSVCFAYTHVTCGFHTIPVTCGAYSIPVTCGFSNEPTTYYTPQNPVLGATGEQSAVQLAAVKQELEQLLKQVEEQQAAAEQSLQPQSLAQVEELQSKMREALAELDKQKAEFQKKGQKK